MCLYCQLSQYRLPKTIKQKWQTINNNNSWRVHQSALSHMNEMESTAEWNAAKAETERGSNNNSTSQPCTHTHTHSFCTRCRLLTLLRHVSRQHAGCWLIVQWVVKQRVILRPVTSSSICCRFNEPHTPAGSQRRPPPHDVVLCIIIANNTFRLWMYTFISPQSCQIHWDSYLLTHMFT